MRTFVTLTLATVPALAAAHEGHGVPGAAHWHATDAWGFLALAVVLGLLWWQRGK
jgi:hypothetical protein